MKRSGSETRYLRRGLRQGLGLVALLSVAGLALAGPGGLLAWSENRSLLEQRRAELARLTLERDELRNRVDLLDARHADPDLAGELVRSRLNVAHADEAVMLLH